MLKPVTSFQFSVYHRADFSVGTDEYFVFIFNQNHAQIYDKNGLKEGTVEGFRNFITRKTEKEIQRI